MLLEAGILPALDYSTFNTTPETADFTDMVNSDEYTLSVLEQAFDYWLDPAAAIVDNLDFGTDFSMLDDANLAITQLQGNDETDNIAYIDQLQQNGVNALVEVYQVIPGEAWSPVPPAGSYLGGTTTPPTINTPAFTFANLTRPNAPDWQVGDQFSMHVNIPASVGANTPQAGVIITIYPVQNGVVKTAFNLGTTDQLGNMTFTSYWEPADVGNWQATLYATQPDGTVLPENTFNWSVNSDPLGRQVRPGHGGTLSGLRPGGGTSSPLPGPTPAATVQLVNFNNPGSSTFRVGDGWVLNVNGAPGAAVVLTGVFNGNALAPAQLGTTDASGFFTTTGVMDQSTIGSWTENYTVGGVAATPAISFNVFV